MGSRRLHSTASSNLSRMSASEMEAMARVTYDDLVDDVILGLAFDVHRSVKTGLFAVTEAVDSKSSPSKMDDLPSSYDNLPPPNAAVDVFGHIISTTVGVPALKKQPECVCPNCQRNLAASRFAPHLEKCMGMGRNSSRLASRRLATSSKDSVSGSTGAGGGGGAVNYRESAIDEDDAEDEDWIEPAKTSTSSRRRHQRDKNSPRRHKGSAATASTKMSLSKVDYEYIASEGTLTPPSSYDQLTVDERSNLLANICGVISTTSRKICIRTPRCPVHTDAQRREVRIRWLSNDEETHVDIDSFTEGDTVALRESLAQLSSASSPAESTVSTSSNPSANSSIRGGRREKARRGNKKGRPGSKNGSRGSTPPLMAE